MFDKVTRCLIQPRLVHLPPKDLLIVDSKKPIGLSITPLYLLFLAFLFGFGVALRRLMKR